MQKKFITNLAFLLLLNLVIKPFWLLGIDRTVQNTVGAEAYGHYYALFNFTFLFNILLDLGITNFNNRNIAQNRHLLDKHLAGIILLRVLLAVGYVIVSLIVAAFLGYESGQYELLGILILNQILISFILYLRSNISALHLFKTDSIISVLDRAIMIVVCGMMLWGSLPGFKFTIQYFVWAQTGAYIVTVLFCLLVISGRAKIKKLNWSTPFFLMILRQAYPYAILILLMTFYNRIDSVMLERLLTDGSKQAGIYAQAFRLLDASNMIAYLFAGLLLPMFAHMLKHKEDISALLRLAYSLLAVPAITLGIIALFYAHEIMNMLYVEHVADSSIVFSVLMCCFFAISTTYVYGTLLTANGNLKQLNGMAALGMVLNLSMNFYLIPKYQATGAAISSLITQSVTAFVQVVLCYKLFHLTPDKKIILRFFTFISCGLLIAWLFKQSTFSWLVDVIGTIALCAFMAVLLKLINVREIIFTLRKEGSI
ncbi:MAG TPA: oligosaccharide flippase family protein [Bacteroidia bacterium]|nr:oligosaccharide flippase family protein [Bacteroidia bacterium]